MSCSRAEHKMIDYLNPTNMSCSRADPRMIEYLNPTKMSCSRVEPKMIEYLSPMKLFRETIRMDYYSPVFLGFSFTEKSVIVTVSNDKWSPPKYSEFATDGTHLDKLVGEVRKCVDKHELRGIIVEHNNSHNNSIEDIHDLMDKICKKGNFKGLKYAFWKDDFATTTPTFKCNQFGTMFWGITIRVECPKRQKRFEVDAAHRFLLRFTYLFTYLYMDEYEGMDEYESEDEDEESEYSEDEDEESGDEDLEREDEDLEREEEEHSERKMIKYLKPLQFFRQTMERDYHMPPVFVLVSFNDAYAFVAISDDCYLNARTYGIFPIGKTLLDKLAEKVEEYELVGIIFDNSNSIMDIHNLMDDLCKKGNFKSFKYTCWKDNIASTNPAFECNKFGSLFWGITVPVELSELQKRLESAQLMLQTFLDVFKALYIDKNKEIEYKDEKREDSKKKEAVQGNLVKVLYRAPSVCVNITY